MILELHADDASLLLLNVQHIVLVNAADECASIVLSTGRTISVTESYEVVRAMLATHKPIASEQQ